MKKYGPNTIYENQCDRGRLICETFFNILESFLERMKHNPKLPYFIFNFIGEYTHASISNPPYYDQYFSEMLIKLERKGYFDDTLFIFYSDHGSRLSQYSFSSEYGMIEKNMPILSVRMPKALWNTKYFINARNNQDKLISFYDLYQTLRHFLHINKNYTKQLDDSQFSINEKLIPHLRGISLFEPIPTNRSCADAMIPDNFCRCISKTFVTEEEFKKQFQISFDYVFDFILDQINDMTLDLRNICMKYEKKKIHSVTQYERSLNHGITGKRNAKRIRQSCLLE